MASDPAVEAAAIRSFRGPCAFLSNFAASPFDAAGITWPTVEHAYQAAKCVDAEEMADVISAETPALAKRRGRLSRVHANWHDIRLQVMRVLVHAKFEQNPVFLFRLRATGQRLLVEGNTWGDTFWGVDEVRGGENHLGLILMDVRAQLAMRRVDE